MCFLSSVQFIFFRSPETWTKYVNIVSLKKPNFRYLKEQQKDHLTMLAYQGAVSDCWLNNCSDYKASCRGILEDYMACLNVYKAKYGGI